MQLDFSFELVAVEALLVGVLVEARVHWRCVMRVERRVGRGENMSFDVYKSRAIAALAKEEEMDATHAADGLLHMQKEVAVGDRNAAYLYRLNLRTIIEDLRTN